MWHIKVPASTANLGSGFDSLGMALALPLECWFSLSEELVVTVRGEGEGVLEESEENLVWRTAQMLHQEISGMPMPLGHLTIKSRIPLARGLGSSAAAIVAGLILANTMLPERLSKEQLLSYATQLEGHPDNVAAALYGGFVMAFSDQGRIRVRSYVAPELRCLLLVPDYKISTEAARHVLPNSVPLADAVFNGQRLALWIDAITRRDWSLLPLASDDRLHQPYRKSLIYGFTDLTETALQHGAAFSALSGSGPTIITLVSSDNLVAVAQALTTTALEVIPVPFTLHDITPSYFGAESVLDGWQWHSGERMGFNTRQDQHVGHVVCR